MLTPIRIDAIVDLAYGLLIVLSIILIATLEFGIGLAFGLGVFSAYVVHVVWKMARFDPDWMTQQVEETVEESVSQTLEQQVRHAQLQVEEAVEAFVDETVEKQVMDVQERVEAVDDRISRRPREDEVEEIIEDAIEKKSDR